ncbi:MAG: copper transporter [Actinobacteria bacterium]|nr:copper transporter [Actinomycetota bacterium]
MLNFRYHALSLVAVFLSLAIGLLLGVAIGDKGLVSSAEQDVRKSLRADVREAQAERDDARARLQQRQQFEQEAYPGLVGGRLTGRRIALIELGGPSDRMWNLTKDALQNSGARLTSVSVVREPLQLEELAAAARGTRYERLAQEASLLHPFATRLGLQFTHGGRLLRLVRRDLLRQGSGALTGADGVVLVRNTPQLDGTAADAVDTFEDGLVRGLRANDLPVVGVETTDAESSQVAWFKDHELSSVDDLDDPIGRAALVFALAGQRGSFGVKATADGGRLPPLLQ